MAVNRDNKEKRAEQVKKNNDRDARYEYYARSKPSEHAERFFRRPAYSNTLKKTE